MVTLPLESIPILNLLGTHVRASFAVVATIVLCCNALALTTPEVHCCDMFPAVFRVSCCHAACCNVLLLPSRVQTPLKEGEAAEDENITHGGSVHLSVLFVCVADGDDCSSPTFGVYLQCDGPSVGVHAHASHASLAVGAARRVVVHAHQHASVVVRITHNTLSRDAHTCAHRTHVQDVVGGRALLSW